MEEGRILIEYITYELFKNSLSLFVLVLYPRKGSRIKVDRESIVTLILPECFIITFRIFELAVTKTFTFFRLHG